jgi:hypothetical protein
MPSAVDMLRGRLSYAFILMGVVWLGFVYVASSLLVLWPAVTCLAGGALLLWRPKERFTSAWVRATAVLGFVLGAYMVLVAAPLLGGSFALVAGVSLVAFLVIAAFNVLLFALSGARPEPSE